MGAEFSARIGMRGQKTPDSMAVALQQLHDVGVPGDAKLVITGAQGGWAVTAYWTKQEPGAPEAGQEQNQGDRDTPPGFERE